MGDDDDDDDDGSQNTDDYLMDESYPLEPDEDDLIRQGFQIPPNPVPIKLPSMPDLVMTPVDQTVIPENFWKNDKQKARITEDKQIKNQSTKAKPDVKTPYEKKSSNFCTIFVQVRVEIVQLLQIFG
ncbi:hypothetical protein RhiirA5_454694 [Rhizophagus irregularis]|uniref:Uncharacterized protein n=1 Tax=Rhizophagus irregularis TaxID=588596 RepID=A0A2N0RD62_9GLOM|nr:hypothetical protein RhiirA5_454694 [Rhizophagus irregularis]PKC61245.1 hypothetical protein RhiirA1_398555 [Rhizophagus irregularis]